MYFFSQILNARGEEVGANVEGEIAVRYKPTRPLGLFTQYVVSVILDQTTRHFHCSLNKLWMFIMLTVTHLVYYFYALFHYYVGLTEMAGHWEWAGTINKRLLTYFLNCLPSH
jgi:hypothetical protein